MANGTSNGVAREVATLLRAKYPLIAIESGEERRVERVFAEVGPKLTTTHNGHKTGGFEVLLWSCSRGITDMDGEVLDDKARSIPNALEWFRNQEKRAILIMRDAHHWFREPLEQRAIRDAGRDLTKMPPPVAKAVVFLSPTLSADPHQPGLPKELQTDMHVLEWPLPTRDELMAVVEQTIALSPVDGLKDLSAEGREQLVSAATGLTIQDAYSALSRSLVSKAWLDPQVVAQEKRRIINESGALEWLEPEPDGLAALGGWENAKPWFAEMRAAYSAEARAYGLRLPKGALSFGVPGMGKTLLARALAGEWGVSAFRLNVGALFGGIVGESLHPDEEVYFCDSAGRNVQRMTMAEAHERYTPESDWHTWTFTDWGGSEIRRVTDVVRHDRKEQFLRIMTRSGRSVIVTEGHSVFGKRKREAVFPLTGTMKDGPLVPVEAGALKVGDRIAIARRLPNVRRRTEMVRRKYRNEDRVRRGPMDIVVTPDLMTLFGLWVGDGSLHNGMLRISCDGRDEDTLGFLRRLCHSTSEAVEPRGNGHGLNVTLQDRTLSLTAHALDVCGRGKLARTKRIPDWVFGCSNVAAAAFLRGYFSADGSVSGHVVEVSTVSARLADDTIALLAKLDIMARLRTKSTRNGPVYRITISKGRELRRFQDAVGFLQKRKMENLASAATAGGERYDTGRVQRGVLWDEVEAIEPADGPPYSYDLSVDGTEKFICGGVVVHNTDKRFRLVRQILNTVGRCILLVDEIEKAVGSGNELDGGSTSRLRGEFLTWLESRGTAEVFVLASANNIEQLAESTPEMLRKGRWDEKFYVSLPHRGERLDILQVHVKKRQLTLPSGQPKFLPLDVEEILNASDKYSAAEIEDAVESAQRRAFAQGARQVTTDDIVMALKDSDPLSKTATAKLESTAKWAKGKARRASKPEPKLVGEQRFVELSS